MQRIALFKISRNISKIQNFHPPNISFIYPSTTFQNQNFATNSTPCPFRTLKIPKNAPYTLAKKTFLQIAMQNHPDVLNQKLSQESKTYQEDMQRAVEAFMKARKAFEALVADDDGKAILKIEKDAIDQLTDAEFDQWFEKETGFHSPQFDLDPKTMREVAAATETMGGGLDRDGGMWTLANMVTNSVKKGKEAGSTLRLEAGDIKNIPEENLEGILRRKRRRGGRASSRY